MFYSYAKLSKYDFIFFRILGPGLGNLLFPWARSVVAGKKYGLKSIFPAWPQIKFGPIIRLETDLRFYGNLFLKPQEAVSGVKKIFLLATKKKISELELGAFDFTSLQRHDGGIFIFEGLKNYFNDFLYENKLIKKELIKITKKQNKNGLDYDFSNSVTLHIRRGDFNMEGWITPAKWFLYIMDELRKEFGESLKFKVFSDGTDEELAPILNQKNTEKLFFGTALADLLAMSNSKIFVGSHNSTFSMWASFLGRMPTIWPKGGLFQNLHYEKIGNEIEVSFGEKIPESFIINCKNNLD